MNAFVAAVLAVGLVGAGPGPLVLAQDTYFFVGGQYVKTTAGTVMDGQMYVHAYVPERVTHRYPIVFVSGINQSGTNFEGTPDGREGWAQFFVRAGYKVYVTDQPARGRSEHHPDLDGPVAGGAFGTAESAERNFTDPQDLDPAPWAKQHTQWPGSGRMGDPVFDQMFASQVDSVPTRTGWSELHVKSAGAALLDRIGPSILITHSQGGAFGWQIADARPGMVKAIIAVEPALSPTTPETGSAPATYGITGTPITYDPAVTDPKQIVHVPEESADAPDVARCWL